MELHVQKNISIMDNTLREGEQTPGVAFAEEQKINIARHLDKIGVDYIETGFPAVSQSEFDVIRKIAAMDTRAKTMALARTQLNDIDLVIKTGCKGVTFFMPTSDILLDAKNYLNGKSKDTLIDEAAKAVDYAKKNNLFIAFGAEDFTRTDFEFIIKLYRSVINAGADIVALVDTTSRLTPISTYKTIRMLKQELNNTKISTHLHNDFGMATGNTISAMCAGADQIQVTINGLGERAGSPSIQEVVMSAKQLLNVNFDHIKTEYFKEVSDLVYEYAKIEPYPLNPIIGMNAFSHESGLHASSVMKNPLTYESFAPEEVGIERKFIIGKHTGKSTIKYILENEFRIKDVEDDVLDDVLQTVKQLSLQKRLDSNDVYSIFSKKTNQNGNKTIQILLRDACLDDAATYYEMYDEMREHVELGCQKPSFDSYQKMFSEILSNPNYKLMAIMDTDSNVVGVMTINVRENLFHCKKIAYVDEIVISEPYRGKGYGAGALHQIVEFFKANGDIVKVELSTDYQNTPARKFYSNIGFSDYAAMFKYKIK